MIRRGLISFVVVGALALVVYAYGWWLREGTPSFAKPNALVPGVYHIAWQARDNAPAVEYAFSAGDITTWNPKLSPGEWAKGDRQVVLAAIAPNTGRLATLANDCSVEKLAKERLATGPLVAFPCQIQVAEVWLHRDDAAMTPSDERIKQLPGSTMWVRRQAGAWVALGPHYAPQGLERWLPAWFGLASIPVRRYQAERAHPPTCAQIATYGGRSMSVLSNRPCADAPDALALAAAFELFERAAQDAKSPPDLRTQLARLRIAAQNCLDLSAIVYRARAVKGGSFPISQRGAPLGVDEVGAVCGHAVRLGHSLLKQAPVEASGPMLQAIATRESAEGARDALDDGLAALAAAGKSESREALFARALRLDHLNPRDDADRVLWQRHVQAIVDTAPRVLAAEDPVFAEANRAMRMGASDDWTGQRHLAYLRDWRAKAVASAPASDSAHRARFWLCLASVEREVPEAAALEACGDELVADWQARIAAKASFDIYGNEAELAMLAARSYYGLGSGAGDVPRRLASLRSVVTLSKARFSAVHDDYVLFWKGLGDMERLLAQRAGEKPSNPPQ